jgi:hypothetical protein
MLSKKIAIAAIAGASLLAATGVYARDDHFDHYRGHDRYSNYDRHYYDRNHYRHAPRREVVRQYYAPAPVYYAPAPQYNAPSRPVISGQIPIGNDRNINIEFQL